MGFITRFHIRVNHKSDVTIYSNAKSNHHLNITLRVMLGREFTAPAWDFHAAAPQSRTNAGLMHFILKSIRQN